MPNSLCTTVFITFFNATVKMIFNLFVNLQIVLIFYLHFYTLLQCSADTIPDEHPERTLLEHLLTDYYREARPVSEHKDGVFRITIGITLNRIVELVGKLIRLGKFLGKIL